MRKLKAGLVAGIGLVVGAVTLRWVRRRRNTPEEDAKTAIELARTEAEQAAGHAAAAMKHARTAGGKAVEHTRDEVQVRAVDDDDGSAPTEQVERIQEAGKDLIQR